MKKLIIALTAIVLIATGAISFTHYYSVKILSATRAYTNFESQYSKGEKDASRHLMSYIYSHDESDYLFFKNDISIPIGDSIAKDALVNGKDKKIARIGFLMAGNHPDDLPDLIWFYHRFKNEAFFKSAIQTWQQADIIIGRLNVTGAMAYRRIQSGHPFNKADMVLRINTLSDQLTLKQQKFSATIGETSRVVERYVFIADVAISLLILISTGILAGLMLKKIHASKKIIVEQNDALIKINERINNFVYNVTHDLRSPITSLTGLIAVLEKEKDITQIPNYTAMMLESLQLQDKYIQDVLYAIKEDDSKVERCNLKEIVSDVISQNSFFAGGKQVNFVNELEVWDLKANVTELKVIFNNLVSNAVKYADFTKPEQWIKVKSYKADERCIIEIEDNGLGIRPEQKKNIFKKYFKSGTNKKSMGLGLYFTKQAIEGMNGTITVKSLTGRGTSFIVALPLN